MVRVPGGDPAAPGAHQTYQLFGEPFAAPVAGPAPGPGARAGGAVWLTDMSRHRMGDLLRLVRRSGRAAATLGVLADDFGLLDFEGRSFPGWHHHMTLMSAAYAYTGLPALRERWDGWAG